MIFRKIYHHFAYSDRTTGALGISHVKSLSWVVLISGHKYRAKGHKCHVTFKGAAVH